MMAKITGAHAEVPEKATTVWDGCVYRGSSSRAAFESGSRQSEVRHHTCVVKVPDRSRTRSSWWPASLSFLAAVCRPFAYIDHGASEEKCPAAGKQQRAVRGKSPTDPCDPALIGLHAPLCKSLFLVWTQRWGWLYHHSVWSFWQWARALKTQQAPRWPPAAGRRPPSPPPQLDFRHPPPSTHELSHSRNEWMNEWMNE